MKYNRTLSAEFIGLLSENGQLRWLFDFVKNREDLDFLTAIVKGTERILVYRGLSKILDIKKRKSKSPKFDAAKKFKELSPNLFSKPLNYNFQNELMGLIQEISKDENLRKYYDIKKEGYYQNILSRRYGINSNVDSEFVIIDKEVVVSYQQGKIEKAEIETQIKEKYQRLQREISGKSTYRLAYRKDFGNELDFLALDKDGNVLLIEFKHGANTGGIYWSSLQVGVYYEIFNGLDKKEFEKSIFEMLKQKQRMGLINPDWVAPKEIKEIIPVVMISEFDEDKGTAKKRFDEVLKEASNAPKFHFLKNLRLYKFNDGQLIKL